MLMLSGKKYNCYKFIIYFFLLSIFDIISSSLNNYKNHPHLSMTGESRGCSRGAAPVCGFSRGTTARSVSPAFLRNSNGRLDFPGAPREAH